MDARDTTPNRSLSVVIAGGGVAALEALLALRALAGRRCSITLVSPEPAFTYRPASIAEAFEQGRARSYSLAEIVGADGPDRLVTDAVAEVDATERVAITAGGQPLPFDALVIATGATPREAVPGALTFRGGADVAQLRAVLDDLVAGRARSIALALPSERIWPLPIYELALLTASFLRNRAPRPVEISIVTPEERPLELFGPAGSEAVAALLSARGIRLHTSWLPTRVRDRALVLAGGAELFADRVVALPLLEGRPPTGVPCDRDGFIPVDAHGRVAGLDGVYAAGDATAFPLKQGGLAAQSADAVAETIAAHAGAAITPSPFTPVLRGLLMTGGAPLYLRAEPQRLARETSVAIDAGPRRHPSENASAAAQQALWWPPAKIAGRYLAPRLAGGQPPGLSETTLTDRRPVPGPPVSDEEWSEALELALLLADCDVRWGDYASALIALDAAEALHGVLPAEYETKREQWRRAAAGYVNA